MTIKDENKEKGLLKIMWFWFKKSHRFYAIMKSFSCPSWKLFLQSFNKEVVWFLNATRNLEGWYSSKLSYRILQKPSTKTELRFRLQFADGILRHCTWKHLCYVFFSTFKLNCLITCAHFFEKLTKYISFYHTEHLNVFMKI